MITFTIFAVPPSSNHYTGRRGNRYFQTQETLDFLDEVIADAPHQGEGLLLGELRAVYRVYFADKRTRNKRDMANIDKVLSDSLQGIIYENDWQIRDIRLIDCGVCSEGEKIEVEIEEL